MLLETWGASRWEDCGARGGGSGESEAGLRLLRRRATHVKERAPLLRPPRRGLALAALRTWMTVFCPRRFSLEEKML